MTAAGAAQSSKTTSTQVQDQRTREPSMEDILASIRRIIADDQSQVSRGIGGARRTSAPSIPAPTVNDALLAEPEEDVLDLAKLPEAVVSQAPIAAPSVEAHYAGTTSHEAYSDHPESSPSDAAPAAYVNGSVSPPREPQVAVTHVEEPAAHEPEHARGHVESAEDLISPRLGATVMSSFETLAATVVLQNQDMLDRVMHDALRPLLKSWLDDNLPALVERLVRVEIERMARGARG